MEFVPQRRLRPTSSLRLAAWTGTRTTSGSRANEEIDFFDPQRQRDQREQSETGRFK